MPHVTVEEVFEDLWDQMEELSKSCDISDGKLSRGIARHLVGFIDLPQSYRIRAHMALTSVLCAQDALRDAEENYAEVQAKVSTGRHAQIQAELHTELQAIREAYKNDSIKERFVTPEDEAVEDTTSSPSTATTQRGFGSQEDPIDLTLEDDSAPEHNASDGSPADSGYMEGTDTMSAMFSLSQSSMVIVSANSCVTVSLTTLSGFIFIRPSRLPLLPALTSPPITTCTSATNINRGNTTNSIPVKESCLAQHIQPWLFKDHPMNKYTRSRKSEGVGLWWFRLLVSS